MTKGFRFPINKNNIRETRYYKVIEQFPNDVALSYFVKEEDSAFVKIGMVCNKWGVQQRLSSLQTSTPHQLVLVGISDRKEKDLHRQFAHLRVRGEWFNYSNEIKSFLKNEFPVPPWLKSMKCPSCKQRSTFREEEIHKYGDSYPLRIADDGTIYVDRDDKRSLYFPSEKLDRSKCICDNCNGIVNIAEIELVEPET